MKRDRENSEVGISLDMGRGNCKTGAEHFLVWNSAWYCRPESECACVSVSVCKWICVCVRVWVCALARASNDFWEREREREREAVKIFCLKKYLRRYAVSNPKTGGSNTTNFFRLFSEIRKSFEMKLPIWKLSRKHFFLVQRRNNERLVQPLARQCSRRVTHGFPSRGTRRSGGPLWRRRWRKLCIFTAYKKIPTLLNGNYPPSIKKIVRWRNWNMTCFYKLYFLVTEKHNQDQDGWIHIGAFRDPFVASNLVSPYLRAERYVGPRISLGPNRLRSNQAF